MFFCDEGMPQVLLGNAIRSGAKTNLTVLYLELKR